MFSDKTTVLIVDDMMTMRKIVTKACSKLGITKTIEAENGIAAWKILNTENNRIDMIISDWNMPEMSGLDLLKKVRGTSRYKMLPFVLVTAESDMAQVQEAVIAGVDTYVVKPFDQNIFEKKVSTAFKKYNAS